MTALAPTLQAFFTDRLADQRGASEHTIAAYRDTWRLLLGFASQRTGKNPSQVDIADLDAPLRQAPGQGRHPHRLPQQDGTCLRDRSLSVRGHGDPGSTCVTLHLGSAFDSWRTGSRASPIRPGQRHSYTNKRPPVIPDESPRPSGGSVRRLDS